MQIITIVVTDDEIEVAFPESMTTEELTDLLTEMTFSDWEDSVCPKGQ